MQLQPAGQLRVERLGSVAAVLRAAASTPCRVLTDAEYAACLELQALRIATSAQRSAQHAAARAIAAVREANRLVHPPSAEQEREVLLQELLSIHPIARLAEQQLAVAVHWRDAADAALQVQCQQEAAHRAAANAAADLRAQLWRDGRTVPGLTEVLGQACAAQRQAREAASWCRGVRMDAQQQVSDCRHVLACERALLVWQDADAAEQAAWRAVEEARAARLALETAEREAPAREQAVVPPGTEASP